MKKLITKLISITIPEIVVIGLVCLVTVGLIKYYGYQGQVWQTFDIQLTSKNWQDNYDPTIDQTVPRWLVENINQNDVEYAVNGDIIGKVKRLEVYEHDRDSVVAFMTVTLRGIINKRTHQFLYKNRPTPIGGDVLLQINGHQLPGQIIQVVNVDKPVSVRPVHATLRIRYNEPWMINTMLDNAPIEIKELTGKTPVLTLDSFKFEPSATGTFMDYNYLNRTRPILTNSNEMKDAVVSATFMAKFQNNRWYYAHNKPLKMGSLITISTPTIGIVNAEIQHIDFP